VEHGTNVDALRAAYGLSFDDMYRRVKERCRHLSTEAVEIDA
jgi:hypothetical protein